MGGGKEENTVIAGSSFIRGDTDEVATVEIPVLLLRLYFLLASKLLRFN